MQYIIHRLPEDIAPLAITDAFRPDCLPAPFAALPEADITISPWAASFPDRFPAHARVGWNESGLIVLMYAEESPVLSRVTRVGDLVCEDSCLEFFLMPFPAVSATYVNIEMNPLGTPHVGLGEGRHGRRVYETLIPDMDISAAVSGPCWAVSYRIPTQFLHKEFGAALTAGQTMRGNFYKCSEAIHPHFAVWNPIEVAKPDYHRPEYFGEMVLG